MLMHSCGITLRQIPSGSRPRLSRHPPAGRVARCRLHLLLQPSLTQTLPRTIGELADGVRREIEPSCDLRMAGSLHHRKPQDLLPSSRKRPERATDQIVVQATHRDRLSRVDHSGRLNVVERKSSTVPSDAGVRQPSNGRKEISTKALRWSPSRHDRRIRSSEGFRHQILSVRPIGVTKRDQDTSRPMPLPQHLESARIRLLCPCHERDIRDMVGELLRKLHSAPHTNRRTALDSSAGVDDSRGCV
jgi:hypothetical protein